MGLLKHCGFLGHFSMWMLSLLVLVRSFLAHFLLFGFHIMRHVLFLNKVIILLIDIIFDLVFTIFYIFLMLCLFGFNLEITLLLACLTEFRVIILQKFIEIILGLGTWCLRADLRMLDLRATRRITIFM